MDKVKVEISQLEKKIGDPAFWSRPALAKATAQKLSQLKDEYNGWETLKKETTDLQELAVLAEKENEDGGLAEEISKKLEKLKKEFSKKEFFVLFSEKHDPANAILAIHAGTGGTEAQDWAQMLLRMYLRYCEKKGWSAKVVDQTRGAEAGIKSAIVEVSGRYAFGHLKAEAGVHRLVRISPFDSEKMRHTSFALVEVWPEFEDVSEVEIDPKDLRIDTFLAGGHGGQGVQTTYSAVRIVHLPTGITVSCQNERSQAQNKETAMKILKSRLLAVRQAEQAAEKSRLKGKYLAADWGNQIRSYVLQPYRLVKDHRSKWESADTDAVLEGELDAPIEAFLKFLKALQAKS